MHYKFFFQIADTYVWQYESSNFTFRPGIAGNVSLGRYLNPPFQIASKDPGKIIFFSDPMTEIRKLQHGIWFHITLLYLKFISLSYCLAIQIFKHSVLNGKTCM